jgi:unsaturated rhamnogalacturonyl hydrolase
MLIPAGLVLAQTLLSAPLRIAVHNDLPFARQSETVEIPASRLSGDLSRIHVFEHGSGKEILAQALSDRLIFQSDIPAKGEQTFDLRPGEPHKYKKEDFRVYGRFVRERLDDFAWENDRIAHRMYGAALETWPKEPLTSSAVDVWLKRTRRLVINDWYMVDDYHHDHGEGGDFYSAGASRGCGGVGLWREGHLVVSKNFRNSRVLAAGPIRLVFELEYPGFETKRVTLDAGQNFNRFESRFSDAAASYAAGIKKFANTELRVERAAGWMRAWGPVVGGSGHFACTLVFDPAAVENVTEADGNYVMIGRQPALYYAGTAWDQAGDFATVADWDRYVEQWTERVKSPLRVEIVTP